MYESLLLCESESVSLRCFWVRVSVIASTRERLRLSESMITSVYVSVRVRVFESLLLYEGERVIDQRLRLRSVSESESASVKA